MNESTASEFKSYQSWDKPTRIFHWLNVITVMLAMLIALVMLNKSALGISGLPAKIALKELHTIFGYVFSVNLFARIVWGFVGGRRARFTALKTNATELKQYRQAIKQGKPLQYVGHNPKGKLAIIVMFTLCIIIGVTGLIRSGTDIYYPPFGSMVTQYIAVDGVDPTTIKPYDKTGVDKAKVKAMSPIKSAAGLIHRYAAYLLMLIIFLHIFGVILAENRQQPGIISAMFSGKKWIKGKAADE